MAQLTKPSNRRLFRCLVCGLTLRYHKSINSKAEIYGGVMPMNRIAPIFTLALIAGCTVKEYVASKTSDEIYSELKAKNFESLDLSNFGGNDWTKICFLGPYNEMSGKALGFNWQVSEYTDVLKSDGHNVIVFATESEVIEYVVHSRGRGDFWQLSGKCFNRNNSKFIKGSGGDLVPPKA